MKVGFTFWYGDLKRSYSRISGVKKAGFDFLEISLDYPWPLKRKERLMDVLNMVRDSGIGLAIHGPWRDIKLSSPIENIRKASVQICKENIIEASKMKPDYILFHLDTDQAVEEFDEIKNEVFSSSIKSVDELLSLAESLGVDLFFENVPKKHSSPDLFEAIASRDERFLVCLDIGHAIVSEFKRNLREVKVENIFKKWKSALGNRVKLMHLHGIKVEEKCIQKHLTMENELLNKFKGFVNEFKIDRVVFEIFRDFKGNKVNVSDLKEAIFFLKEI